MKAMAQETYYSYEDDVFRTTSIDEVYEDALAQEIITLADNPDEQQILVIHSADFKTFKASRYFPDFDEMADSAANCAYDIANEFAEDWCDTITKTKHTTELVDKIKNIVDEWAEKHNLQPTFSEHVKTNPPIYVKPLTEHAFAIVDKPNKRIEDER